MTFLTENDTDCYCAYLNRVDLLSKVEECSIESSSVRFGNTKQWYVGPIINPSPILNIVSYFTEGSSSYILYFPTMIDTTKERKRFEYVQLFTCINYQEIKWFLSHHPDVANSLLSCYSVIRSQFGNIRPILEVIKDQENTLWETLFISIPHELDFQIAFERLNYILDNWFFSRPTEVRKKLTLTIL